MAGQDDRESLEARARHLVDGIQRKQTTKLPDQAKVHRMPAPGVDLGVLAHGLGAWYAERKLKVQVIEGSGAWSVQCRTGQLRRAVGMATALTVVLHRDGSDLLVEIGPAKWGERGVLAGVGAFVNPILLGTAAWGAWEQGRLPEQSLQYIRSLLPLATTQGPVASAAVIQPSGSQWLLRARAVGERSSERIRRAVGEVVAAPPPPGTTASETRSPPAPEGVDTREVHHGTASPSRPRVDVNSASLSELMSLTVLTRVTAERVIAHRHAHGPFATLEGVADVAGMKPHELERMRQLATVAWPSASRPPAPPGAGKGRVIDV